MIRMVITDLDQTALRDDGSVSERTKRAFAECRRRGIVVGIATARLWINAEAKRRELGADWLICSNGSRVMYRDALWEGNLMPEETVERLTAALHRLPGMKEILLEDREREYINTHRFRPPHPLSRAVYTDFSKGLRTAAFQVFAGLEEAAGAKALLERFPECRCLHYRDSTRYAFLSAAASKEGAVKRLAGHLGIPLSETAAFGDDEGDIGLLSLCGMGVAMGNALPEVKRIADAVTKSNEEDGVAAFLERV